MLKITPRRLLPVFLFAGLSATLSGQAMPTLNPEIPKELVGQMANSARAVITLDKQAQPHIVVNDLPVAGFTFDYFARINGIWQVQRLGVSSALGGGFLMRPDVAYDPDTDRLWVAGWRVGNGSGEARVWQIRDASTGPTRVNSSPYRFRVSNTLIWGGQVHYDPRYPGQIIVSQQDGHWRRINASAQTQQTGQIFPGANIEKQNFAVSAVGEEVVYHASSGGHSPAPSGYQNSVRVAAGQGRVVYAAYNPYADQRWDYFHPGLGIDRTNARMAYMAWTSDRANNGSSSSKTSPKGLFINVYNGSGMVFPSNNAPRIDDVMGNHDTGGSSRAPIQFAPVSTGGTWMAYTTPQRKARLVFVSPTGQVSDPFPGQDDPRLIDDNALFVSIGTDADDNLGIVWGDGTNIYYMLFNAGYKTEPATVPGWGEMEKVIGRNLFLSEQFGELTFVNGEADTSLAYSYSLGTNIFRTPANVFISFDYGILTPTPTPGLVGSEFFGDVTFGVLRSEFGGSVNSERFGWMTYRLVGGLNRLTVQSLNETLTVFSDGTPESLWFNHPTFGPLVPQPGSLTRYYSGIGFIDVVGTGPGGLGLRTFVDTLGVELVLNGPAVSSPQLGTVVFTDNSGWIQTSRFGLVHFAVPPADYNGFIFTQRFGWVRFEKVGNDFFFWAPQHQSWFAAMPNGSFFNFDLGFMFPIAGEMNSYTSVIGVIHLDDQNPSGWIRSDRFGFVWPFRGTNATWFYSQRRDEVLGLTPGGGIWSTRDALFLQ